MNNQLIGLLLVAGAAMLLFGRKQPVGQTQQAPDQGTGNAAATNAATNASTGTEAESTGVPGESTGTPPPDDVLEQAAFYPDKAHLTGDWRYSWHAWNYYRAQAAVKAGLCDPPCAEYAPVLGERFGLTDSQGLTAAEYHGYLSQLGVSGLSAWRYLATYRRPWQ